MADVGPFQLTDRKLGRSEFLKRCALLGTSFGAAELVFHALPRTSISAPSPAQDRAIFGFMLLLEEVQTAFYSKVLAAGTLDGEPLQFAQTVGAQEQEHLAYLHRQHGAPTARIPAIHISSSAVRRRGFLTAAVELEELGLGAYNGQAPNLTPDGLRHAGRIISVEARHVAWARSLAGELPAPTASDVPLTEAEVLAQAKKQNYVS